MKSRTCYLISGFALAICCDAVFTPSGSLFTAVLAGTIAVFAYVAGYIADASR